MPLKSTPAKSEGDSPKLLPKLLQDAVHEVLSAPFESDSTDQKVARNIIIGIYLLSPDQNGIWCLGRFNYGQKNKVNASTMLTHNLTAILDSIDSPVFDRSVDLQSLILVVNNAQYFIIKDGNDLKVVKRKDDAPIAIRPKLASRENTLTGEKEDVRFFGPIITDSSGVDYDIVDDASLTRHDQWMFPKMEWKQVEAIKIDDTFYISQQNGMPSNVVSIEVPFLTSIEFNLNQAYMPVHITMKDGTQHNISRTDVLPVVDYLKSSSISDPVDSSEIIMVIKKGRYVHGVWVKDCTATPEYWWFNVCPRCRKEVSLTDKRCPDCKGSIETRSEILRVRYHKDGIRMKVDDISGYRISIGQDFSPQAPLSMDIDNGSEIIRFYQVGNNVKYATSLTLVKRSPKGGLNTDEYYSITNYDIQIDEMNDKWNTVTRATIINRKTKKVHKAVIAGRDCLFACIGTRSVVLRTIESQKLSKGAKDHLKNRVELAKKIQADSAEIRIDELCIESFDDCKVVNELDGEAVVTEIVVTEWDDNLNVKKVRVNTQKVGK